MSSASSHDSAWTGGDSVSEALLSLASDRDLPEGTRVAARFVELAQQHGLIGFLSEGSNDQLVHAIRVRELARSGILSEHLARLLVALHQEGVRASVLKGPSIAARYSEPSLRTFSDLDILVPSDQMEMALRVLSEDQSAVEIPGKRPRADKRDVSFQDPTGVRFNVDLHWDLFSYSQLRGDAKGATDEAWREAVLLTNSALGPSWELPAHAYLAFLATHSVLDHRFRLILFRDILELARNSISWEPLFGFATEYGLRSTTYLALWLAKHAIGAPLSGDVLASLRPSSLPLSFLEWSLPRVDLVRFDGHSKHPVNLATVLLNDSSAERRALLIRAPFAVKGWKKRIERDTTPRHRPRTLIVVTSDRRRGAEVFGERLRDGLVERGWVVEALGLYGSDSSSRARVEPLVEEDSVKGRRLDPRVLAALLSKIRSFSPDVVIANGGPTLRYMVLARAFCRFRLVYVGIGEPEYWIKSKISRWLNRILLRLTDYVIAVSETTRDQLVRLEPRLEKRIRVGYTGVPDLLFMQPTHESQGPLRVLMIGSLTEEKDPLMALRAAARVDDCLIRFVGAGPLARQLVQEAKELKIQDRMELAGSVTDVRPHLAWAHVLVLTSRTEGLPGAILEAGAAGVPTVAMDVGGVAEAVRDGVSGFVVGDERELSKALEDLNDDRSLLFQMGEGARRHIASQFTIDQAIDRYSRLLLEFWR